MTWSVVRTQLFQKSTSTEGTGPRVEETGFLLFRFGHWFTWWHWPSHLASLESLMSWAPNSPSACSEDRKQEGELSPVCWRHGFIAKHFTENCPQELIKTKRGAPEPLLESFCFMNCPSAFNCFINASLSMATRCTRLSEGTLGTSQLLKYEWPCQPACIEAVTRICWESTLKSLTCWHTHSKLAELSGEGHLAIWKFKTFQVCLPSHHIIH